MRVIAPPIGASRLSVLKAFGGYLFMSPHALVHVIRASPNAVSASFREAALDQVVQLTPGLRGMRGIQRGADIVAFFVAAARDARRDLGADEAAALERDVLRVVHAMESIDYDPEGGVCSVADPTDVDLDSYVSYRRPRESIGYRWLLSRPDASSPSASESSGSADGDRGDRGDRRDRTEGGGWFSRRQTGARVAPSQSVWEKAYACIFSSPTDNITKVTTTDAKRFTAAASGPPASIAAAKLGEGGYGCVFVDPSDNTTAIKVFGYMNVERVKAVVAHIMRAFPDTVTRDKFFLVPRDVGLQVCSINLCPEFAGPLGRRFKTSILQATIPEFSSSSSRMRKPTGVAEGGDQQKSTLAQYGVYRAARGVADLSKEVMGTGFRTSGSRLQLARSVIEAVAALERMGLVHGDIRPANVMLHEGRAKLIDFDGVVAGESEFFNKDLNKLAYMGASEHYPAPPEFIFAKMEPGKCMSQKKLALLMMSRLLDSTKADFAEAWAQIPGAYPTTDEEVTAFIGICNLHSVWSNEGRFGRHDRSTNAHPALIGRYDAYGLGLLLLHMVNARTAPASLKREVIPGLVQWDPRRRWSAADALAAVSDLSRENSSMSSGRRSRGSRGSRGSRVSL